MPAVYLVLGLPGSGRREIISGLIEDGLPDAHAISLYEAVNDRPPPGDAAAAALAARPGVTAVPYVFAGGQFAPAPGAEPGEPPDVVFFLADGRASPIDQLEAFPAWLQTQGWELTRILLVAHCTLAATQPAVALWHEACVHFADCVLLNRRGLEGNTWAQQFQKKISSSHFPCVFVPVKNGRVDNAMVVLFPEARRLTLVFDKLDPLDDLEDLEDDELPEDISTLEGKLDPYFERMPNGRRCKQVPDVTEFLPA